MLRFLDGPAAGKTLMCVRAPKYLRVVRDTTGAWDALDQLSDTPELGEAIFAYCLEGKAGSVHLQLSGPGGRGRRCRWEQTGDYRLCPEQPAYAVMRDTESWRRWAQEQDARERATADKGVTDG